MDASAHRSCGLGHTVLDESRKDMVVVSLPDVDMFGLRESFGSRDRLFIRGAGYLRGSPR